MANDASERCLGWSRGRKQHQPLVATCNCIKLHSLIFYPLVRPELGEPWLCGFFEITKRSCSWPGDSAMWFWPCCIWSWMVQGHGRTEGWKAGSSASFSLQRRTHKSKLLLSTPCIFSESHHHHLFCAALKTYHQPMISHEMESTWVGPLRFLGAPPLQLDKHQVDLLLGKICRGSALSRWDILCYSSRCERKSDQKAWQRKALCLVSLLLLGFRSPLLEQKGCFYGDIYHFGQPKH